MQLDRQIIELFAAKQGILDDLPIDQIHPFLESLYLNVQKNNSSIIKEINDKKELSKESLDILEKVVADFKNAYVL